MHFNIIFIGDDARALEYIENVFISSDWQKKSISISIPVQMSYLNKTTYSMRQMGKSHVDLSDLDLRSIHRNWDLLMVKRKVNEIRLVKKS